MKKDNFANVTAEDADPKSLNENAFRELKDGEEYRPMMHPTRTYKEATPIP